MDKVAADNFNSYIEVLVDILTNAVVSNDAGERARKEDLQLYAATEILRQIDSQFKFIATIKKNKWIRQISQEIKTSIISKVCFETAI